MRTTNDTLTELIIKSRKGDKKAEKELCYRAYQKIFKHLYNYKCPACNIDDIAQETIIKMIKILPSLKIEQLGYSRYLHKITRSVFVNFYKKHSRELKHTKQNVDNLFNIPDKRDENTLDRYEIKIHLYNVCSAISNLKDIQQKVIYLFVYKKMSYKDIAKKLNKTIVSVDKNILKVRKQLRNLFPEHNKRQYVQ